MDSCNLFNCAARIKEEPADVSFTENDDREFIDKTSSTGNFRSSALANITRRLETRDDNREIELDDMEIELECREEKPKSNSLLEIDNSLNYMQFVKMESVDKVKKEFHEDDAENLATHVKCEFDEIDKTDKDITFSCRTCGRTFRSKNSLKKHINGIHKGIAHDCDICGKKFTLRSNLRVHVLSVHRGVRHACDACGKKFVHRYKLKVHTRIRCTMVSDTGAMHAESHFRERRVSVCST